MTQTIRLSLPSKGRLQDDALNFLAETGLASISRIRANMKRKSLRCLNWESSSNAQAISLSACGRERIDFGITGIDVLEEKRGENGDIIVLHDTLGFGPL